MKTTAIKMVPARVTWVESVRGLKGQGYPTVEITLSLTFKEAQALHEKLAKVVEELEKEAWG